MPDDHATYYLWTEQSESRYTPLWSKSRISHLAGKRLRRRHEPITSGHMYFLPPTDDGRQRRLEVVEP